MITADLLAGRTPDPKYGKIGKQRSLHNNYLTLPVLLFMVSNHYPFLYSHPSSWLVVALIVIAGGMVRHFLNRTDAGEEPSKVAWAIPAAALALIAAISGLRRARAARAGGRHRSRGAEDHVRRIALCAIRPSPPTRLSKAASRPRASCSTPSLG